jgi:hypothetical protein
MVESPAMARPPERDKNEILSAAELKELRENMSRLSPQHVQEFYQRAYEDCRMIYTRVSSPKAIQTLVQVWKQLWKWRRR